MDIFLIVLAAILILIFILLFTPVSVKIFLSKKGRLSVRFLFIKLSFNLYGEKKTKKEKRKEKSDKPDKKQKKNTDFLKSIIKDKGVLDGSIYILQILKALFDKAVMFIKSGRFKELNFFLNVSEEQAADTAIAYGGICTVAYPLIGLINANFKVDKENIDIKCSYLDKKVLEINFSAVYKVQLIYLLKAIILFALDYNSINPQNKTPKGSN